MPASRSTIGKALLTLGLCLAAYFFFVFDTAVQVPTKYIDGIGIVGGERVHNIGLMQNRTLGGLVGIAVVVIGVVMIVSDQKKT